MRERAQHEYCVEVHVCIERGEVAGARTSEVADFARDMAGQCEKRRGGRVSRQRAFAQFVGQTLPMALLDEFGTAQAVLRIEVVHATPLEHYCGSGIQLSLRLQQLREQPDCVLMAGFAREQIAQDRFATNDVALLPQFAREGKLGVGGIAGVGNRHAPPFCHSASRWPRIHATIRAAPNRWSG